MILSDVLRALEAKNIEIALPDMELHYGCDIDSNCPIAIRLKGYILETGITFLELMDGYESITVPEPKFYSLPEIKGEVSITIGGKVVEIDLTEEIDIGLRNAIKHKIIRLERGREEIKEIAADLYYNYVKDIRQLREQITLPQLQFNTKELISAGCYSSVEIGNRRKNYVFIFPQTYRPEYIINNGILYLLKDEDIEALTFPVNLEIRVTSQMTFLQPRLLDKEGNKFYHYHGAGDDCWGELTLPPKWEGTLRELKRVASNIEGMLKAINNSSLMTSQPDNMIHAGTLLHRSEKPKKDEETQPPPTSPTRARRIWGDR